MVTPMKAWKVFLAYNSWRLEDLDNNVEYIEYIRVETVAPYLNSKWFGFDLMGCHPRLPDMRQAFWVLIRNMNGAWSSRDRRACVLGSPFDRFDMSGVSELFEPMVEPWEYSMEA